MRGLSKSIHTLTSLHNSGTVIVLTMDSAILAYIHWCYTTFAVDREMWGERREREGGQEREREREIHLRPHRLLFSPPHCSNLTAA